VFHHLAFFLIGNDDGLTQTLDFQSLSTTYSLHRIIALPRLADDVFTSNHSLKDDFAT
jgi:hypothetical protein